MFFYVRQNKLTLLWRFLEAQKGVVSFVVISSRYIFATDLRETKRQGVVVGLTATVQNNFSKFFI